MGRRAAFAFATWMARHTPYLLKVPPEGSSFVSSASKGETKEDDLLWRVTLRNLREAIAEAGLQPVREDLYISGFVRRNLPSFCALASLEQTLVPTLTPGDIVIADNLAAHNVAGGRGAIERVGATRWYLPPYSPDLNPIALCFAKLKALVRAARCRSTETLWPFLGACLPHFSPEECRNNFRHCGYPGTTRS